MPLYQEVVTVGVSSGSTMTMPEEIRRGFGVRFFSEQECDRWFFGRYYPDGARCPECGAEVTSEKSRQNFYALRRFTCSACHRQPRATKGTVLQDSPLSPRELIALCLLLSLGVDLAEVGRLVGYSADTVRAWRDKFVALAEVGH